MKSLTTFIVAVCLGGPLLSGLCHGDLIRFKDGIELGGDDVEVVWRKGDRVQVRVWPGTITLNTDRIASITIDFEARVAKLQADGKDTAKNLFDLGALCDQSRMIEEAAEAYKLALRKEIVPEEMLGRLAEIFEKRRMWPEAKAAYDRLLLTNPADAELQKKAAFCREMAKETPPFQQHLTGGVGKEPDEEPIDRKTVNELVTKPEEPRNEEAVRPPDNTTEPVHKPEEPEPAADRDGLEANPRWRVEQWGNNATCEVVVQDGDNKLLSVAWTQKDKDKVAIRLNVDMNLADMTKVTFDVYNDATAAAGVCMAFNTLPGYQFFESLAFNSSLKKWVPLEIDLTSKKFKCAATNWRYTAQIANKDNVKDIFILIYNRDAEGALFIDNIRFHGAAEGE